MISNAQEIIDPCFASLTDLGYYYGSNEIQNVCSCGNRFLSTDIIEWDGEEWIGALPNSNVFLPPPPGCNYRAIWMGYEHWTRLGEAVAFKLSAPLREGSTYSFTFTYASDGYGSDRNFSPLVYTHSDPIINSSSIFQHTTFAGRFPPVDGWTTNTFTFTASRLHDGDLWLILRALDSSGMILSNCEMSDIPNDFLGEDRVICEGDYAAFSAPQNKFFQYNWNTGEKDSEIIAIQEGLYTLEISNLNCTVYDEVFLQVRDCELRLTMPNYFSPNGDDYNQRFIPKEINYVSSGTIIIYNRWGKRIFNGDLLTGWDGFSDGKEVTSGVYYYEILYVDEDNHQYEAKGSLTLAR